MGILIKGMEMPKQMESPITITIFKNGSVWMNDVTFGKGKLPNAKAVALPEHGRLKDESVILQKMEDVFIENFCTEAERIVYKKMIQAIFATPTIVEASNEQL